MVDRAIYIGHNGAVSQQFGIDVLSNNITNINTVGYRAQRATFADLFSRLDRPATEFANQLQSGHGVDLSSTDTLFRQGDIKASTTFSDVAVFGDGFFVLKDPRLPGVLQNFYTRAGNFQFDAGVASSGTGNPFTSGGQVVFLREQPTYSTLPRLVDPATGRVVQGYLADTDGVIQTTVADLTVDPSVKDPAKETKVYSVTGTLDSDPPAYQLSLMKDSSNSQLSTVTGSYNGNQDRGTLSVQWAADGSGTWTFLKPEQTVSDSFNTVNFSAGTVKIGSTHSFIPGVNFLTHEGESLRSGSFTVLVGPFKIESNGTGMNAVEGVYLGNRKDGELTITTTAAGAVSWSFIPEGGKVISESGAGTFSIADSATSTVIPGIKLRKPATLLSSAVTSSATSITVEKRDNFPQSGDFVIGVESEQMLVTAGQGTGAGSFTVTRGYNGTTAASHSAGAIAAAGLSAGKMVLDTKHIDDTASAVSPLFDDSTPNTQHTLITSFKQIRQNEYGYMVDGQSQETYSDSAISTLTSGQRRLTAYANIDPNEMKLRRVSDNATLNMASSVLQEDTAGNLSAGSIRGAFWSTTSDLSGKIAMTIAANGSGSWNFTPSGQTTATASGTFAAGTLLANTTYTLSNANEIVPGLSFTTGSAISAGTVSIDSTIGVYSTFNNLITFSPVFSPKITSTTSFIADYKFDAKRFTNSLALTGTNLYQGVAAFDEVGAFLSSGSTVPNITFTPNSTLNALTIAPTLTSVQQLSGQSAVNVSTYDGNLEGILQTMEFLEDGRLQGVFTNGKQKNLAQLVLARFRNPGGLNRVGDTAFQQTTASGEATVQAVDQINDKNIKIIPKTLEFSNSNFEDELSDLIFYQRAFQFSGRVIRAADELVQNAIALKR